MRPPQSATANHPSPSKPMPRIRSRKNQTSGRKSEAPCSPKSSRPSTPISQQKSLCSSDTSSSFTSLLRTGSKRACVELDIPQLGNSESLEREVKQRRMSKDALVAICEAPTPQHAKKSILSERIEDAESGQMSTDAESPRVL